MSKIGFIPFTELVSEIIDNRGKTCPVSPNGLPLIATNCIKNDALYPSYETNRFVSQETYKTWFRGHPKAGDLIFVTKGSPGQVCIAPDPVDFCIAQDMVAVRADESKIYPKYLFAVLRSEHVQKEIENMHVGTLIPHFKKGDFHKLKLPVPNEDSQILIGNTYYNLSNKIELNRQMNATLETMARALFKAWFVDFEPVRANSDNRLSESASPEIAKLFPSDFQESEIGSIPKEWKIQSIYETAKFVNGRAFKQNEFSEENQGLPVIKIAELKNGLSLQTRFSENKFDGIYRVSNGDTLFSWSGSPETSIDIFIWIGSDGWLNQHIFKIYTKCDEEREFVYFLLREFKEVFIAIAKNKQTTGLGHVTAYDLKRLKFVKPPQEVLNSFNNQVSSIFNLIISNKKQNEMLKKLRDSLLLRLISGKIRVGEAENEIAHTV